MKINKKFFLLIIIVVLILKSCIGTKITSFAGNVAMSEKGVTNTFDDVIILTKINTLLINEPGIKISDIDVTINKGEVLLTGIIDEPSKRLLLIKKIWKIKGVKKIFNEIEINKNYTISERYKDFLLTSKIKTYLLFNSKIYSTNYTIDSFKGNIYLMGITTNFDEIEIIENYIKNISGVKKLKTMLIHKK